MEVTKTPILKDIYTNSIYQSQFLPLFEKAEIRIKELILAAFLFGRSKFILRGTIALIIGEVAKKIPVDLHDKDQYIKALQVKSEYMIRQYYDAPQSNFQAVKETIMGTTPQGVKVPILRTPKETIDFIRSGDLWAEAKGTPNVINYPKEVKLRVTQLAQEPVVTQEPGKKPISLWQKAELDCRYENQMQNLQNMRVQGVKYAYLSSHPNCSKRCQCWQGALVSLEEHAPNPQTVVNYKTFKYNKSSFVVGRVDGKQVYSLPDIMNVVDNRYGYHNNIISGFNCRHRLIPFDGQNAPKEYSNEDIKKQREIESKIRELERTIRLKKKQLRLYNELGDKLAVKQLKSQIDQLTQYYKSYCEKNGYAWYKYRIDI